MKVDEWMRSHPVQVVTVRSDTSLEAAVDELMLGPSLRDVYVVDDDGVLLGHLSHERLLRLVLDEHRHVRSRRQLMERVAGGVARDLMNSSFPTANPNEELDNVLDRAIEHRIEDLPVVDDRGVLIGAINLTAVLRETRRRDREGEEPL